jgi:hypothetical protein
MVFIEECPRWAINLKKTASEAPEANEHFRMVRRPAEAMAEKLTSEHRELSSYRKE